MNKIKYISIVAIVMTALTVVVEFCAPMFLTKDFSLFWIAPLYFGLFYIGAILLFGNRGKSVNHFMLFKGVKIFVTMALMFVLAFVFRQYTIELTIYFLVYYMLLLVAESLFLLYIKKRL